MQVVSSVLSWIFSLLPLPTLLKVMSSILLSLSHQGYADDSQTSISSIASFRVADLHFLTIPPAPQIQHDLPTKPRWMGSPFTQLLSLNPWEPGLSFAPSSRLISNQSPRPADSASLLKLQPCCSSPFPLWLP